MGRVKKQPGFILEDFLPYRLSLAANSVSQELAKIYAPYDLTRTQWRILAVLSGGEMTASGICQKTMMDKTTISRAVKNLITRKLIRRKASQNDGRRSPLTLSAKGQILFDKLVPLALAGEAKLRARLNRIDLDKLENAIDQILGQNIKNP